MSGPTLTRRGFVKTGGALIVTLSLPAWAVGRAAAGAAGENSLDPTVLASWLEIRADGTIIVRTGRAEMGVGMSACYPQMVAEELDVRPESIELVMGHTDETPDGGWSADYLTGAENLRKVAAYTRGALLGLAAERLGVAAPALSVADGVVSGGGGSLSYVDLVAGQQLELTIPITGELASVSGDGSTIDNAFGLVVSGDPALKSVRDYKVIGRDFPMPGIPDQVTGRTEWVGDVKLPGMLHARMVRPATLGSTLISVPELDRSRFPAAEIVTKQNLVAVVSPDEWEAVKAARAVQAEIRWSDWEGLPGSDNVTDAYRSNQQPMATGDADAVGSALAGAARTLQATYSQQYVKHAPIGPYVAVADVRPDGAVTVHTHSANTQALRAHIALMLGTTTDKVIVRWHEGAGQYGRVSLGGDGAEADAVILSQLLGKPVRVQWTLREDLAWSSQSPGWVADLRAGLDAAGKLVAIQTDWYAPHQNDARMLGAVLAGMPTIQPFPFVIPASFGFQPSPGGVGGDPPYAIPHQLHRAYPMHSLGQDAPSGVGLRGNIMRTPGHRQNVFALESLVDEAAAAVGADPIQYRMDHDPFPRLADLMQKTADAAEWRARPSPNPDARRTGSTPVTGRGMATVMRFGACWVGIAEVEVVPSSGEVRVTRFTLGVDPGKIINPLHLRRNMEGGIMMGLGEALKEEVVFDGGKVTSDDWRRYPIPTMADMPEIRLVQTSRDDAGFGGGGEAANTVPAPAIAAAVFDAIGVQPRRTPITSANVRELIERA